MLCMCYDRGLSLTANSLGSLASGLICIVTHMQSIITASHAMSFAQQSSHPDSMQIMLSAFKLAQCLRQSFNGLIV